VLDAVRAGADSRGATTVNALVAAAVLGGQLATAGQITGARLTVVEKTDGAATKTYAVAIENLRDMPIEAVGFDELAPDGRTRGSERVDFCLADPDDRTPGRGRIQPHERREFPVSPQTDRPPRYTLTLVIFDDLSYEGSIEARDEVLRRRADRAFEYEFAVQALKSVPALAVRGIEGFLTGRRTDWAQRLQEQGKSPGAGGPLEEALRQARESPERFQANVDVYRGAIEQQLARLRRHLPPGGIAGAKLTIVDRSARTLVVTIENHRDSPLVEWYVESSWASSSRRDPVAPRSRREFSVDLPGDPRPATDQARLVVAAFEDGYYEGSGPTFERWVAARNERRDDLAYWTKAFASLPRISEPELRKVLADHVALRASRETHMTIRHVTDRVQEVLNWTKGADVWPRFDQLRKDVEAEYLAITRVPSGTQPGPVGTVTAATVVSADVHPTVSYTIILENLRDVPIEAFGIQDYDLATGRVRLGTGTDFCTSDPGLGPAGSGRIMPHEKRDLGPTLGSGPTVPLAKLNYVMFDDLQYEGDPVERVRLLRFREVQAGERVFALAALDEAAAKPASELEAFFVQKREQYLRQMQRDGKPPSPISELESFIGSIRRNSAERFAAGIPATRERLAQQIVRLRRHLSAAAK
jgi:hypothetical protein